MESCDNRQHVIKLFLAPVAVVVEYSHDVADCWPHNTYVAYENRACGHKLHPIALQAISQCWNMIFAFCNLHHIQPILLGAKNVIAIVYRYKSYESRKFEKVGKNCVPTYPVFAGPVT